MKRSDLSCLLVSSLVLALFCGCGNQSDIAIESPYVGVNSIVDIGGSNERQIAVLADDVYQYRLNHHRLKVFGPRSGKRGFSLTAANISRRSLYAEFDSTSRLLELSVPVDDSSYIILKRVDRHWYFVDTNGAQHLAEFCPTVRFSFFKDIPSPSLWTMPSDSMRGASH
jgi:hypothetical protein